jgi:pimeloyl-ACP methyl ester carboxylesterase
MLPARADVPDEARLCRASNVPVALHPGAPQTEHIYAELCLPQGKQTSTVQLLVHGITYDHTYWDFPDPTGKTDRYSYVDSALAAGFATLNIDRIGNGKSSHPAGNEVTIDSNAFVIHQLTQALRSGSIASPAGAQRFKKVVLVGHSYGSWVSWYVGSDYRDVDGIILSGISHSVNPIGSLPGFSALVHPAPTDPAFSEKIHDFQYLTTRPGTRYDAFYRPGNIDPAVLARDEATKGTVTVEELINFPTILSRPLDITVPVLLVNGTDDGLFCGHRIAGIIGGTDCSTAASLAQQERPLLGKNLPSLDSWVLPGAGHDLNTVLEAKQWFDVAQAWVGKRFGDPR